MAGQSEAKKQRPNLRQRRVAATLKEWRKRTGRSQADVGAQLRWSAAKVNRFENEQPAGPAEIIALAAILGVDEEERDRVVTYAVKGQEGLVWWRAFVDAGQDFDDFMLTESEATLVRNKESLLLPGLGQDEAYTTAAIMAWETEPGEVITKARQEEIDKIIEARREVRRRRQMRVTTQDNPMQFRAIIYRGALDQPVLPPRQMAGALGHLLSIAELPNVTVQILETCAAGFDQAYHLMNFEGEGDAAAVFVDMLTSGLFIESNDDVATYSLMFERLARQALKPEASARRIDEVRRALLT